jgi:hypothetical protein
MKEPRVKETVEHYRVGNIKAVYEYLTQTDMFVDPNTWCGNIKNLIENKQYLTAQEQIELIAYKILKNI